MPYGFAQRVVEATPETILKNARRAAREAGLVTGPVRNPHGAFDERYLPIVDGPVTGRLWVWALTSRLSVAYLGLSDGSPFALVTPIAAQRRLRRRAGWLLDQVGAEPAFERDDLRVAA